MSATTAPAPSNVAAKTTITAAMSQWAAAVSYTHLTLPTILLV